MVGKVGINAVELKVGSAFQDFCGTRRESKQQLGSSKASLVTRCILTRDLEGEAAVAVRVVPDLSTKIPSQPTQELQAKQERYLSVESESAGLSASKASVNSTQKASLSGIKTWTRNQKFEAALGRVWSSRDPGSFLANAAETVLTLVEQQELHIGSDPKIQLADNFAPVQECPPTFGLEVTGIIPECLNGVYVRNGANPQFEPTAGYHYFDGDGMLHAVRIKDGIPSYCCRYTQTHRYLHSKASGRLLYMNSLGEMAGVNGLGRMSLLGLRVSLGLLDFEKGCGTANAGLAFYQGRLLAMSEDDMPYAVHISPEDGDLHTLGRYVIPFLKNGQAMSAHPKVDPITGEMFSYTWDLFAPPYLQYWHMSGDRTKHTSVTIDLKESVLVHDFAVTEKYAVLPDPIMLCRVSEMLNGKSMIVPDEKKTHRFGILPKYATDDSAMRWFNAPGSNCMHYINAWEEGDEVVVISCSSLPASQIMNNMSCLKATLFEFRMNLQSGKTSQRPISDWNIDSGQINQRFRGRKSRYAYLCVSGPWPKFAGIVKVDLSVPSPHDRAPPEVGVRRFQPGCYCSEPYFVPRTSSAGVDDPLSEDDGYIVSFLHNENTNVSELGIFDARSPTLEPVATIKLPARVPYGFHGIFLSEQQLSEQISSPF